MNNDLLCVPVTEVNGRILCRATPFMVVLTVMDFDVAAFWLNWAVTSTWSVWESNIVIVMQGPWAALQLWMSLRSSHHAVPCAALKSNETTRAAVSLGIGFRVKGGL